MCAFCFGAAEAIIPGIEAAYGAAHASELITSLVGEPVDHQVLASDPWTARLLIADTFQDRRVFLVGESAHVNPPWGGHGFNTCVGDAVNIAWKIAAVEHGWAPAGLLASYEPERRGVIEQTVTSAESNMASLAGDLTRDGPAIHRAKRAEFHSLGLVLGYTYAGSPVIQAASRHAATTDMTCYTPRPSRARGCPTGGFRTAHLCTTGSARGSRSSDPCTTAIRRCRAGRTREPPEDSAVARRAAAVLLVAYRVPARPPRPTHRMASCRSADIDTDVVTGHGSRTTLSTRTVTSGSTRPRARKPS
jgi:hypothetical protein